MRTIWIMAAVAASLALGSSGPARGADFGCQQQAACGCNGSGGGSGYCDPCGGDECGALFCRQRGPRYEGLEPGFNCGCNGSYKFPVPPLYTYHWPGMWSAQLMTDYHSPWRFPPLKPYVDELPTGGVQTTTLRRVQQASATSEAPRSQRTSFSSHLVETIR